MCLNTVSDEMLAFSNYIIPKRASPMESGFKSSLLFASLHGEIKEKYKIIINYCGP